MDAIALALYLAGLHRLTTRVPHAYYFGETGDARRSGKGFNDQAVAMDQQPKGSPFDTKTMKGAGCTPRTGGEPRHHGRFDGLRPMGETITLHCPVLKASGHLDPLVLCDIDPQFLLLTPLTLTTLRSRRCWPTKPSRPSQSSAPQTHLVGRTGDG